MATYDNLPVYKASYDLLLLLFRCSKNMDRDYRHTLGETIKQDYGLFNSTARSLRSV